MFILLIRSHALQIIFSIGSQCNTNGIHGNAGSFKLLNLRRAIPPRIIQRFSGTTGCTVRNENHIARTGRLITLATTIQIFLCFGERCRIVGAAVSLHLINLLIDFCQIICQILINCKGLVIYAAVILVMCKTNNR